MKLIHPKTKAAIVADLKEGLTITQVARKRKKGFDTIRRIARAAGVANDSPKGKHAATNKALELANKDNNASEDTIDDLFNEVRKKYPEAVRAVANFETNEVLVGTISWKPVPLKKGKS